MDAQPPMTATWVRATVVAVLRHPSLWGTAVVQALRVAAPGWWRRAPFLPLPDPAYLAFRLETQYGTGPEPRPDDVITYLHWCRSIRDLR